MFLLDFLVLIIFPGDPLLHSSLVIPSLKKRQQPLLNESNSFTFLPSKNWGARYNKHIREQYKNEIHGTSSEGYVCGEG